MRLDLSAYLEGKDFRSYELGCFNISAEPAGERELNVYKGVSRRPMDRVHRKFARAFLRPERIKEPHFHYWPGLKDVGRNAYLIGFWQSEKYFLDAVDTIRREFTFKNPPEGPNRELAERIAGRACLSIHIRRGDYVTEPTANQRHGLCGLDYYAGAIELAQGRASIDEVFVFSDDPEWAAAEFRAPFPTTYVGHNSGDTGYEDMRLMSMCRFNIIANSTFSWWAAWLNADPERVVVAPERWFKAEDFSDVDLIPADWLRV